MCVAILCTAGTRLTDKQIRDGWEFNEDGGGFAYVKEGRVYVDKGYMDVEPFIEAYNVAATEYCQYSPFLVHMRIATSGNTDAKNTHPFRVKNGAVIHNGILFHPNGDMAGSGKDKNSDTFVLAAALFNVLVKDDVKAAKESLCKDIGYSNKLVFLYDDGEYVIVNEDRGFWDKGIWFSNSSCVPNTRSKY
jgi:predicted glutamine amidotransferase